MRARDHSLPRRASRTTATVTYQDPPISESARNVALSLGGALVNEAGQAGLHQLCDDHAGADWTRAGNYKSTQAEGDEILERAREQ